MKGCFVMLLVVFGLTWGYSAQAAEWVSISKGLDDLDIRSLAADPKDSRVIFAGSEKRVYKTLDGGDSWKQILGVKGSDNKVRFIYVDISNPDHIYVATDQGVRKSKDGGKHWEVFFRGLGSKTQIAYCVANSIQDPQTIWVGTHEGLFLVDAKTNHPRKINSLPDTAVYSIRLGNEANPFLLITTDNGIYKSNGDVDHWERVFANQEASLEKEEATTLEQFDVEEIATGSSFPSLIFSSGQHKFYAATQNGVFEGAEDGNIWTPLKGQSLPKQKINFLEGSSETFYAATDRGVFQWDFKLNSFREIYKGLESNKAHSLYYSASGAYLLAATERGVHRLSYPALTLAPPADKENHLPRAGDILERFKREPPILEIQKIAIQYAEVHPKKIEGWRKAAALKALLPKLSVDHDLSRDENVDLDRGGTADPDKFIAGPEERSWDWSVGVSWDLGDLIWSSDQTSIDTRSRLMVELRDDILNQVTHLYYERRRLQIEMALVPNRELPVQIEKEIRLQELTAGIDALTGGYLSKRLQEIEGTQTMGPAGLLESVHHI